MATTTPIRSRAELELVRAGLTNNRDRLLFTLGVNTAFRGGDLLSLNVGDVLGLKAGDVLTIKEQKTNKKRTVTLNAACAEALSAYLAERDGASLEEALFISAKRRMRLTISRYSRMFKAWCEAAGIEGHFASHSARKTLGYLARTERNVPIEVLQKAYGHASPATTLTYICIQPAELDDLYSANL